MTALCSGLPFLVVVETCARRDRKLISRLSARIDAKRWRVLFSGASHHSWAPPNFNMFVLS